ncbi:MAG: translation initiation factor IF-2 subunit gamma [Candidatus Kariarchaeaceae archaeon]
MVIAPEINIGTAGHVDEGKSTLIKLLTGKFPDEHSEELRRGITIRLGYADCDIYECPNCDEPEKWSIHDVCPNCDSEAEIARRVSFVDAPGHEILMQVMLSGAAIMDGVMLVIAANNKVPQPQTREHLAALTALGVEKVVVVQNKVELVSELEARKNYQDIKTFLKGTIAENAPIIPMSAMHGANTDTLLSALQHFMTTPKRDLNAAMRMAVARSFDINRPGTSAKNLKGGVLGGSLIQGKVKINDDVVILPGLKRKVGKEVEYIPVKTKVQSIRVGSQGKADEATPGGLLALQTVIDPSMARSDNLAGSVVSALGSEPPIADGVSLRVTLFESVVGSETNESVKPIKPKEHLLLTIGTATTVGQVSKIGKKHTVNFELKPQIALEPSSKVALSRRFNKRWRLIGWGEIDDYQEIPLKLSE